ncbi:MAG: hypothetical protein ABIH24_07295 [Verrucomicrobiota bacterium]
MKRIVIGLLAVCLLGSLTVLAEEKAKQTVDLQEITATGKLAKMAAGFTLTDADGKIVKIMKPKITKADEVQPVNLEKFVGKTVTVVGMGITKIGKADKKSSVIKTVTSIEEVVSPVAPAATPAATPEATPAAIPTPAAE